MKHTILFDGGEKRKLSEIGTSPLHEIPKEEALRIVDERGERLRELQKLLFATGTHSLLVVLQGRDTAGKDGAIRRISKFVNVQGCNVAGFKVPTEEELAHDFLWRVHAKVPRLGQMTIFNRSHYEDVLVVRVHKIVEPAVWKARFEHINAFERLLTDSKTLVVKFFLHISKEEQEKRLLQREEEVDDAWKLNVNDWKEREHWDAYTQAYDDVLHKCSNEQSPWHVIPADKKWYRDLAVIDTLVRVLEPHADDWLAQLAKRAASAKKELDEFRSASPR